jgi:hypothetical protein
MPYVDGGSFEARLAAGMTREGALGVLLHVCGALAYAHRHRAVHGAVTPRSVLLREGHGPALADFGMSRLLAATGAAPPQGVYGAPEYLAPEQVRGAPIDARADLYALGIVLYRILAGQVPFLGASAAQVLAQQCGTPWRPLELAQPEASRAWNAVLMRALAKAPHERYATAEALAAAIQTAMRQEQALAAGSGPRAPAWQPARAAGPRPPVAAASTARQDGTPSAGPSTTRPSRADQPTPPAGDAQRGDRIPAAVAPRPRLLPWLVLGAVPALVLLGVLLVRSPGVSDGVEVAPRAAVAAGTTVSADAEVEAVEPAGPPILLQDDFGDPSSGWPRASSDLGTRRIGYVDGEYSIVKVANSQGAPFVSRGSPFGDFQWEVDVRLLAPTEDAYAFFDFRRQENGDHYSLILDPSDGTMRLEIEIGSGRDVLLGWTPSAALRRGTARNRVGVRAEGSALTLLANGQEVGRAHDDRLGEGGIAFGVGNFRNGGADGRFDNVVVTALPPS